MHCVSCDKIAYSQRAHDRLSLIVQCDIHKASKTTSICGMPSFLWVLWHCVSKHTVVAISSVFPHQSQQFCGLKSICQLKSRCIFLYELCHLLRYVLPCPPLPCPTMPCSALPCLALPTGLLRAHCSGEASLALHIQCARSSLPSMHTH